MADPASATPANVMSDYNAGHPTTQAIADDVEFHTPTIAKTVDVETSQYSLNAAEIEFFKTHGYLIKRGLLADQGKAIKQATDSFWHHVPNGGLKRDEPQTWLEDPASHWRDEDHARVGSLLGTNWKMRSRGDDGIGTERFLVEKLANHERMHGVASEFLGGPIKPVNRVRGIYGVFPIADQKGNRLFPHGDYMAAQLSAMVLLCDVPPRCGGFTLWPGSHHRMHMCWDRVSGSTITGDRVKVYPRERDQLLRDSVPVEFTGTTGDVIFWHPRVIHSAGVNYSAATHSPMVRILTPIDYQRAGQTYVDDLEYGPGPAYQWWVDTRNVREDVNSTPENIWHGWAIG